MLTQELQRLEAEFYRNLNQVVEPLVRAGVGSPSVWPTGVVALEITGRKSGRVFSIPLLATLVGDVVLVSTVRRRSQWVKNLAANPEVRYWLGGRAREATAVVFTPGVDTPPLESSSSLVLLLATALLPYRGLGMSFAILLPKRKIGNA